MIVGVINVLKVEKTKGNVGQRPSSEPPLPVEDRMDFIEAAKTQLLARNIKVEALFATPAAGDNGVVILFRGKSYGKTVRFAAPLVDGVLGELREVTTSERKRINKKQRGWTPPPYRKRKPRKAKKEHAAPAKA